MSGVILQKRGGDECADMPKFEGVRSSSSSSFAASRVFTQFCAVDSLFFRESVALLARRRRAQLLCSKLWQSWSFEDLNKYGTQKCLIDLFNFHLNISWINQCRRQWVRRSSDIKRVQKWIWVHFKRVREMYDTLGWREGDKIMEIFGVQSYLYKLEM